MEVDGAGPVGCVVGRESTNFRQSFGRFPYFWIASWIIDATYYLQTLFDNSDPRTAPCRCRRFAFGPHSAHRKRLVQPRKVVFVFPGLTPNKPCKLQKDKQGLSRQAGRMATYEVLLARNTQRMVLHIFRNVVGRVSTIYFEIK